MALFFRAPLPAALARQRLKGNVGGLALLVFARTVFTPYLALRALVVGILNSVFGSGSGRSQSGETAVWWIETAVSAVLVYNIFEAAYRVQHPSAAPPTPAGLKLVPVLKSSPLTRSYAPTPDLGTSTTATYTPTRTATQSPLAQSLYKSTPTRHSPSRSSPLSSSTARVLNLQQPGTPSNTGLFFDDSTSASPSKVARPASASAPAPTTGTPSKTQRTNYTIVDREEREWVDNVWKGVKGKSHKLGL